MINLDKRMATGSSTPFLFHRPKVAEGIADGLMGQGPFNYGSGLFLAAPRRTGKSTFMREDLMPALAARDVLATYVDLWTDRQRDPASLISDAVKATTSRGWSTITPMPTPTGSTGDWQPATGSTGTTSGRHSRHSDIGPRCCRRS